MIFGFGINVWILLASPFDLYPIQDFVNYFHTDVLCRCQQVQKLCDDGSFCLPSHHAPTQRGSSVVTVGVSVGEM